jgi:hypothetical protein
MQVEYQLAFFVEVVLSFYQYLLFKKSITLKCSDIDVDSKYYNYL